MGMSIHHPGDYRRVFKNISLDLAFAASQTTIDNLIAGAAKYTIFIQKIVLTITTDAAQTITFQDDAAAPLVIASIPSSPGTGVINWDFGEIGRALTEGKNLDMVFSAAGLAGEVHIEGYMKPTATRIPSEV